jgi:hypothetical protein
MLTLGKSAACRLRYLSSSFYKNLQHLIPLTQSGHRSSRAGETMDSTSNDWRLAYHHRWTRPGADITFLLAKGFAREVYPQ